MPSLGELIQTINQNTYKLASSGVVGLFGGQSASDALETIHLYAGRRWAGWYNYPGTATVAKRFGQMAGGRPWDTLFPGQNDPPEVIFSLAGKDGPDYSGSFSGTKLRTKYLGYLVAEVCRGHSPKPLKLLKKDGTPGRETGSSAEVTVVRLLPRRHQQISESLTTTGVGTTKQKYEVIQINPNPNPLALWAIVPSLISVLAITFSIIGRDYLCGSLILFGVLNSGLSSITLGAATLQIRVPVPSMASPPGDGLMLLTDGSAVVLKGEEADVNTITKGEFELDYPKGVLWGEKHHAIGACSFLLMAQSLLHILLLSLCTLFGQIMFLTSLVASGGYHLYVVSHKREKVQQELLLRELSAQIMDKRKLGTRTQMAVFACLILGDSDRRGPPLSCVDTALNQILPNETPVWKYWKREVLKELERFWKWDSPLPYVPAIQARSEDQVNIEEYSAFTEKDAHLLDELIDDAWCVFNKYLQWRNSESEVEREKSGSDQSHASELEFENVHLIPRHGHGHGLV